MSSTEELAPQSETTQNEAEEQAKTGTEQPEGSEVHNEQPEETPEVQDQAEGGEEKAEGEPEGKPAPLLSEESEEGEPAETPNAPEKYELEAPEGIELDSEVVSVFESVARELDLSNEGAQTILDKVMPAMATRAEERMTEQRLAWQEQMRSDPELGGEKFNENMKIARDARDKLGDDDLKELLNGPLGDNPAMIRLLHRAGTRLQPDGHISGRGTARGQLDMRNEHDRARARYGNKG